MSEHYETTNQEPIDEQHSSNHSKENNSSNSHSKEAHHLNDNQQADDILSIPEQNHQAVEPTRANKKKKKKNKQNSKNNSNEQLDKQVDGKLGLKSDDNLTDMNNDKNFEINENDNVKVNIEDEFVSNVTLEKGLKNDDKTETEAINENKSNALEKDEIIKKDFDENKSNALEKGEIIKKDFDENKSNALEKGEIIKKDFDENKSNALEKGEIIKKDFDENKSNALEKDEIIKKDFNEIKATDFSEKTELSNEKSNDNQQIEEEKESNQKSNGKKVSSANEKIPELLITENNLANKGNKLIIIAILVFKFITYFIIKFIGLFHPSKTNRLPQINEPLLLLSATEITERIKNGQLKCEHVIRAYISRIKDVQPMLNAMIDNCFEEAIHRAKEIDEQLKDPKLANKLKKLPLLGVPFTCKNSISIKGLALTAGVKIRKGIKAEQDAAVIKNLRSAGAIPLCLTNTPELILWFDSDNRLYGRTNNPYDLSRIAGGSSGGEGSLIAAAGSLVGVASDVAGSIRIPSMFNGVFGHKTTFKYVPVDNMFPEPPKSFETFLCFGPITRYATDLPLMLKAMGGHRTDELRLDDPVDFRKIKIYYQIHDGGNPLTSFVDQRIINSIHKVIKYFEKEYGMQTEMIDIAKFKYSLAFFATVSVRGGLKIEDFISKDGKVNVFLELLKSFFGKSDLTRPLLIEILNQKSPYCNADSETYRRFKKMLSELKPKVHELLSDNSVLIMPTWPTIAPKHQTTILRGFDATYPAIMNSLELPATHIPVGLTKEEGLPIGFTVAAGPGQDRLSIAFAKEIEKVFKGWCPPSSQ